MQPITCCFEYVTFLCILRLSVSSKITVLSSSQSKQQMIIGGGEIFTDKLQTSASAENTALSVIALHTPGRALKNPLHHLLVPMRARKAVMGDNLCGTL